MCGKCSLPPVSRWGSVTFLRTLGMSDNEIERLIYLAFRQAGAFMPQTVAEVAAAEAELDETTIELPATLRCPLAMRAPRLFPPSILPTPAKRA